MALTKGSWSHKTVSKVDISTCTVTATTAESDIYTLKTPPWLDVTKPWTLIANAAGATLDGTANAIPLDLYIGYADDFAITGDAGSIGATDGVLFKAGVIDDVRTAAQAILFDPNLQVADVAAISTTGLKCKIPVAPYYAFDCNCPSVVSAGDCVFKIIQ